MYPITDRHKISREVAFLAVLYLHRKILSGIVSLEAILI